MELLVAKTAGFCFGVSRAVKMAYDTINNNKNRRIYTLGPIIHNELVVSDLEKKSVKIIENPDKAESNDIVIIESHGVGSKQIEQLRSKNVCIVDATCPYVEKIHSIVREHCENGYNIIIVGNCSHPEVIGINGWCGGKAQIINSIEQVKHIDTSNDNICVVSQTTNELDKWEAIKQEIMNNYPGAVVFDTICRATYERQREARIIAEQVDVMVVIGSKSSSNTRNLYNICSKLCNKSLYIQNSDDINPDDFRGCDKIGITAGASAPDWLINNVVNKLSEMCISTNI